ncbi:MAG: toprim domain-containing protein, partial [Verrucomicrobiota bacterium]
MPTVNSPAPENKAAAFLSRLPNATKTAAGWQARCPAHEDGRASLSLSQASDGKLLVHCHAGCTPEAVCAALGLTLADLFPTATKRSGSKSTLTTACDYTDEAGVLLFQVCRFEPKDFRQRRPDGTGWTWSTRDVRKVPFHLPQLLAAVAEGRTVYVCEGEKDVLAVERAGFPATCNPGGAGKWRDDYSAHFRAAQVVVVADKDEPGRSHAQQVAGKLAGIAANVKIIELPDTNGQPVKDAADFFAAGGTAADFKAICEQAAEWTPQAQPPQAEAQTDSADIRGFILRTLLGKDAPF